MNRSLHSRVYIRQLQLKQPIKDRRTSYPWSNDRKLRQLGWRCIYTDEFKLSNVDRLSCSIKSCRKQGSCRMRLMIADFIRSSIIIDARTNRIKTDRYYSKCRPFRASRSRNAINQPLSDRYLEESIGEIDQRNFIRPFSVDWSQVIWPFIVRRNKVIRSGRK